MFAMDWSRLHSVESNSLFSLTRRLSRAATSGDILLAMLPFSADCVGAWLPIVMCGEGDLLLLILSIGGCGWVGVRCPHLDEDEGACLDSKVGERTGETQGYWADCCRCSFTSMR